MKSSHLLLIPIFAAASAQADILSDLRPFLSSSRPDFDPASLDPELNVLRPAFAPFSPADSDFGVQQILASYNGRPPVNVSFDTSLSYTDNAPDNTPFDDSSAWFSGSRLDASWLPRVANGWFADIGLAQELFRFEGSDTNDFENFEAHLGTVKSIPELDDLIFYARYEYQRITTGSLSDGSYSAQRIRTGFQKDLLLASRYQLSAGLDAAFDLTADEDTQERNEYTADLSYTYWFADRLSSTLSWTGSLWDFSDGGREDWNHVVGLELTWMVCKNLDVFTNLYYTNYDADKNFDANDFEAWQTGIGFGLNYSF